MENIEIRPIELSEIKDFSWTGSKTHLEHFSDAMKRTIDSNVVFLGAYLRGKAVGRCGIDFERAPGKATLWMFNVHEDFRSKGIGTLMLAQVEDVARRKGIGAVTLNVEEDNIRAQDLYIRQGYILKGKGHESWEEDDGHSGTVTYNANVVHMEKNIPQ